MFENALATLFTPKSLEQRLNEYIRELDFRITSNERAANAAYDKGERDEGLRFNEVKRTLAMIRGDLRGILNGTT